VVDHIGDFDAFGPQFVTLGGYGGGRAGFESEMVEAGGNAEALVDARFVGLGNARNPCDSIKASSWSCPTSKKTWRIDPPSLIRIMSSAMTLKPITSS
jgi:hypothetical protein